MKQRLAESFETALRLADGRAIALEMDTDKEHLFSSKFACPICSYSLQELEPRLFSFNNPMGACPECDGLGQITFFDPKRVVAHPSLSLAAGAVKGWDRRNQFYFQMLQSLAAFYEFDIDAGVRGPAGKGPQDPAVRLGQADHSVLVHQRARPHVDSRARVRRDHPEPGAPLPRDRFGRGARRTRQVSEQPGLPGVRRHAPAPRSALRASIGAGDDARGIFEISGWPLRDTLGYFQTLRLEGAKREIADKVVKEIVARLTFLNNVGLDYLSLERSAETLSGGEAQRIRLASQIGSGLTGVMYVLDEPSIGLHQRDNDRLIATLKHLRDHRQFGDRRRARRGHDPHGRLRGRHGSGRGRARRHDDRRRHAEAGAGRRGLR